MKMKKGNVGIVVLVMVLFVLVIAMAGYIAYDKLSAKDNDEIISVKPNDEEINKTVEKVYIDKDYVYDFFSETYEENSYKIPYINMVSADAANINQEIQKEFLTVAQANLAALKNLTNGIVAVFNISYSTYINENILSLVISKTGMAGSKGYKVYNIDINTGKSIKNTELLSKKGISEESYLSSLKSLFKTKFEEVWSKSEGISEFYDMYLQKTVAESNYSIETPMYLDVNGKINIIATIHLPVDKEEFEYNINTNM